MCQLRRYWFLPVSLPQLIYYLNFSWMRPALFMLLKFSLALCSLQILLFLWVCLMFPGACVLSHLSHVRLLPNLCTVARQAPQSTGFSRQKYWNGVPCLSPTQGSNPHLLHCRWIIYQLSHQGTPHIPSSAHPKQDTCFNSWFSWWIAYVPGVSSTLSLRC